MTAKISLTKLRKANGDARYRHWAADEFQAAAENLASLGLANSEVKEAISYLELAASIKRGKDRVSAMARAFMPPYLPPTP